MRKTYILFALFLAVGCTNEKQQMYSKEDIQKMIGQGGGGTPSGGQKEALSTGDLTQGGVKKPAEAPTYDQCLANKCIELSDVEGGKKITFLDNNDNYCVACRTEIAYFKSDPSGKSYVAVLYSTTPKSNNNADAYPSMRFDQFGKAPDYSSWYNSGYNPGYGNYNGSNAFRRTGANAAAFQRAAGNDPSYANYLMRCNEVQDGVNRASQAFAEGKRTGNPKKIEEARLVLVEIEPKIREISGDSDGLVKRNHKLTRSLASLKKYNPAEKFKQMGLDVVDGLTGAAVGWAGLMIEDTTGSIVGLTDQAINDMQQQFTDLSMGTQFRANQNPTDRPCDEIRCFKDNNECIQIHRAQEIVCP